MEKAPEVLGPIEKLRMIPKMFPYLKLIKKWGAVTALDFAQRFKNPFLREVFPLVQDLSDIPMFSIIGTLAALH